jgi:hypothetical protein
MRYKIEGEFKTKKHSEYYSVSLACGEVFLVDYYQKFFHITDLGDLYLIWNRDSEGYSCISKDLRSGTDDVYETPDEVISNAHNDMIPYNPDTLFSRSPDTIIRAIKSHIQDEDLCVSLEEFNENYKGECTFIRHIDGNAYLYDWVES